MKGAVVGGVLRTLGCSLPVLEVKGGMTLTSVLNSNYCRYMLCSLTMTYSRLRGQGLVLVSGILHCSRWKLEGHPRVIISFALEVGRRTITLR